MYWMRNGKPKPQRPPGDRSGTRLRQRHDGLSGRAQNNYERYLALARDASLAGDTIEMENCYQHAEHYFRLMREQAV